VTINIPVNILRIANMAKQSSKISRVREFLLWFATKHPQKCYFCKEPLEPERFREGDSADGILLHHIDHDRSNNDVKNLVFAHRGCHRSYHHQVKVEEES